MLVALLLAAGASVRAYYSPDGTGNNAQHPHWGAAGQPLLRMAPAAYPPGTSGGAVPHAAPADCCALEWDANTDIDTPSANGLSLLSVYFGQFSLSHDCAFTDGRADDLYAGVNATCFARTGGLPRADHIHPGNATHPRSHRNALTAYLDLSVVYGSSAAQTDALRAHRRGHMRMDGHFPPRTADCPVRLANPRGLPAAEQFCVGEPRGNENTMLLMFQVLFLREHNRLADELVRTGEFAAGDDEHLFQRARALNIAQYQHITVYEFVPALVGRAYFDAHVGPYRGYNASLEAQVFTEFAHALYRVMHSQLPGIVPADDPLAAHTGQRLDLLHTFFRPQLLPALGLGTLFRAALQAPARDIDGTLARDLCLSHARTPFIPALHLFALDCERTADFGLPTLAALRAHLGLPPVAAWADITTDTARRARLERHFPGGPLTVDLFTGAVHEDHADAHTPLGVTARHVIAAQVRRLRDGDRFWYEHVGATPLLTHRDVARIRAQCTMTRLLELNLQDLTSTDLHAHAFVSAAASAEGVVGGGVSLAPSVVAAAAAAALAAFV